LFQDKGFRQTLMDAQDADAIFAAIMAEDERT
jgi:mannitol/fructose-specific phosphotransferase system IIA component (Ntr-type)